MNQYIYVLKPVPRLQKVENWTSMEEETTNRHFSYLKHLKQDGKLILAGKTDGLDELTFGIVVFEASSFEEALSIMEEDPGVKEGIMTATLFPYHVALSR